MKTALIILLLIGIFVISNIGYAEEYAPGSVIVGFYANVTVDEANQLIESYGLSWHKKPLPTYFFMIISPSEEIKYSKDILEQMTDKIKLKDKDLNKDNSLITKIEVRRRFLQPLEIPKNRIIIPKDYELVIDFRENAPLDLAHQLVNYFEELSIKTVHRNIWGTIKVPEGEEQKWAEILDKEDIVRYATPDWITRALDIEKNYEHPTNFLKKIFNWLFGWLR